MIQLRCEACKGPFEVDNMKNVLVKVIDLKGNEVMVPACELCKAGLEDAVRNVRTNFFFK